MPETAHPAHRATVWDRAAITVLGGAGCALSYDALQQMATAIHIRHALTYLFPAVIDGFIAYGVRALLVLRTAPFRARLYIWTLFATATTASIWANALHAVRLNQQTHQPGLHLDDTTVGILSTIAPLALAGAVHLHILITRHSTTTIPHPQQPSPAPASGPEQEQEAVAEPPRQLDPQREPDPQHGMGAEPTSGGPALVRRIGRPPSAELDALVDLVRPVFSLHESPTRAMVREHVRAAGHTLSEDRLTHVMHVLRREREPH
ncbi:DUF2637 domain-containing protein [Actinacidiphila sp. bgisy145]|uniref:DUF2637 domain-containing protein n=1 Tax=Actinacidiphila sp. bgisy145 TaxID=3413792 RepID=UPI003EB8FC64